MKQENSRYGDTMVLTIVLWICSLPLVGLVILPLFGQPWPPIRLLACSYCFFSFAGAYAVGTS